METTQQHILNALIENHPGAFDELYRQYHGLLLAKAYWMMKERFAAEEVVQDTFIEFWEKKLFKNVHTSLDAFLMVIVHRKAAQRIDTLVRQRTSLHEYMQDQQKLLRQTEAIVPGETETGQLIIMQQERYRQAVQQLTPTQRRAIQLVHLEEKTYQESALSMNININTIKTHLKRAMKSLRKQLNKPSPD